MSKSKNMAKTMFLQLLYVLSFLLLIKTNHVAKTNAFTVPNHSQSKSYPIGYHDLCSKDNSEVLFLLNEKEINVVLLEDNKEKHFANCLESHR